MLSRLNIGWKLFFLIGLCIFSCEVEKKDEVLIPITGIVPSDTLVIGDAMAILGKDFDISEGTEYTLLLSATESEKTFSIPFSKIAIDKLVYLIKKPVSPGLYNVSIIRNSKTINTSYQIFALNPIPELYNIEYLYMYKNQKNKIVGKYFGTETSGVVISLNHPTLSTPVEIIPDTVKEDYLIFTLPDHVQDYTYEVGVKVLDRMSANYLKLNVESPIAIRLSTEFGWSLSTITLTGRSFIDDKEKIVISLTSLLDQGLYTPSILSATPSAIEFQIPYDMPKGEYSVHISMGGTQISFDGTYTQREMELLSFDRPSYFSQDTVTAMGKGLPPSNQYLKNLSVVTQGGVKNSVFPIKIASDSMVLVLPKEFSDGYYHLYIENTTGHFTVSPEFSIVSLAIDYISPYSIYAKDTFDIVGKGFSEVVSENTVELVSGADGTVSELIVLTSSTKKISCTRKEELNYGEYYVRVSLREKMVQHPTPVTILRDDQVGIEKTMIYPGDTLEIFSPLFLDDYFRYSVMLRENSKVFDIVPISSSIDKKNLILLIPSFVNKGEYEVEVFFQDGTSKKAKNKVKVVNLVVGELSQETALPGQSLDVSVKDVLGDLNTVKATLNVNHMDYDMEIKQVQSEKVTVEVPFSIIPDTYQVLLRIGAQSGYATHSLSVKKLVLSGFSPREGVPGDIVTLEGDMFSKTSVLNEIFFVNSSDLTKVPATVQTSDISRITVVVPEMEPGLYQVQVTVANNTVISPYSFHYSETSFSGFSPMTVEANKGLTVSGIHFDRVTSFSQLTLTSSSSSSRVYSLNYSSKNKSNLFYTIPVEVFPGDYLLSLEYDEKKWTPTERLTVKWNTDYLTFPVLVKQGEEMTVLGENLSTVTRIHFVSDTKGDTEVVPQKYMSGTVQVGLKFNVPNSLSNGEYVLKMDFSDGRTVKLEDILVFEFTVTDISPSNPHYIGQELTATVDGFSPSERTSFSVSLIDSTKSGDIILPLLSHTNDFTFILDKNLKLDFNYRLAVGYTFKGKTYYDTLDNGRIRINTFQLDSYSGGSETIRSVPVVRVGNTLEFKFSYLHPKESLKIKFTNVKNPNDTIIKSYGSAELTVNLDGSVKVTVGSEFSLSKSDMDSTGLYHFEVSIPGQTLNATIQQVYMLPANLAPSIPEIISISENDTITFPNVLKWKSSSDFDGDPISYGVSVAEKGQTFTSISPGSADTTFTLDTSHIKFNTWHYVKVTASDGSKKQSDSVRFYAKHTYKVTFVSNSGTLVSVTDPNHGSTITKPANPTKTGHTFNGWYADAGLATLFDFTGKVVSDTTLYARWTINTYTITYNSNGGSTVSQANNINHGSTITKPVNNPTKPDSTFVNWYADAGLTTLFDFTGAITSDTTLYAKWDNLSPTAFTLLTPADTEDSVSFPTFSWNSTTDPENGAITYDVYLGTTNSPTSIVSTGQNDTSYTHTTKLLPSTAYYWKVVAKDPLGKRKKALYGVLPHWIALLL